MELKKLFDLTGRTAIITGGAGFLGRQHAAALAEMGADVTLWDMKQEGLDAAAEELSALYPGRIHTQLVEVTDGAQIQKAVDAFTARHGKLNILVNNASLTIPKGKERETTFKHFFDPFESYPVELWDLALKVNLTGIFRVTQALAPLLHKASGQASVINIASDVGVISPDHRIYEPNP
jgi:NAD(P)-dependent dehydrogenase (short-subunit alcohol dehydrogenase family)